MSHRVLSAVVLCGLVTVPAFARPASPPSQAFLDDATSDAAQHAVSREEAVRINVDKNPVEIVNHEQILPLSVSIFAPGSRCTEAIIVTARATGGRAPYSYTWINADQLSAASARIDAGSTARVLASSADGQSVEGHYTHRIFCGPGEHIP